MNDLTTLLLAFLFGVLLGMLFFGALWLTIRRGLSSDAPGPWFFASLLLRMLLTLSGFYLVGHGDWRRLLACLLGFVLARIAATRLTRTPGTLHARRIAGSGT
jgi:F1F0 ATPase subunit 2